MMRHLNGRCGVVICGVLLAGTLSEATPLSNVALYQRCYSQIAGHRPLSTDPLTTQVANNQIDPIAACMQVLNKAQLTANGRTTIASTTDTEAKSVLKTMHNLHASWIQVKDWVQIEDDNDTAYKSTLDLWDNSTPALYWTRSLFDPNVPFSSVVTGTEILGPVRANMDPATGVGSKQAKTNTAITSAFTFAPVGELYGVRTLAPTNVNYSFSGKSGTVPLYGNLGGGVLGNYSYINLSLNEDVGFRANGGTVMPRKWARSVYTDLLCRDLPAVRTTDGDAFVVANSSIPFRQAASCASCHASIDRTAGVVRNVRYNNVGDGQSGIFGGQFVYFEPVTLAAESGWPSVTDADYYKRPTNGVLYFRNYLGDLVSINVANAAQLGTQLAAQDDFYICAAKRYYAYFTGITADIGDLGDPRRPALSTADQAHRNIVIDLGKKLRQHNDLRQLINDIMLLPIYKESDYGLSK